jgi:putative addiction module component (TIGR02574 family)
MFADPRAEKFMTVDEIRTWAMELPREERELLGIALLSSLETVGDQAEVNTAWADEVLARSEAYHRGQVQALDAAETAQRIRQRLATGNGS